MRTIRMLCVYSDSVVITRKCPDCRNRTLEVPILGTVFTCSRCSSKHELSQGAKLAQLFIAAGLGSLSLIMLLTISTIVHSLILSAALFVLISWSVIFITNYYFLLGINTREIT